MLVKKNTTYRDIRNRLWTVTELFTEVPDAPPGEETAEELLKRYQEQKVVAITLYRVGSDQDVKHMNMLDFAALLDKRNFELHIIK